MSDTSSELSALTDAWQTMGCTVPFLFSDEWSMDLIRAWGLSEFSRDLMSVIDGTLSLGVQDNIRAFLPFLHFKMQGERYA